jgi:L-histidine N-alpha-methyltransferase
MPSQATEPRVEVEVLLDEADRRSALHDATFWSLRATPKEIPAVWLYDETGSKIFEEITRLPEYYPTAAEREILETSAAEIAAVTEAHTLVELGAGTSEKTLLLLDALTASGTLERFVPLDASKEILTASAEEIARRYESLKVHAIVGDFERHLGALPPGEQRLIAFLGSTIGNLYPGRRHALFSSVADASRSGDWFLLGVDLVKDPAVIRAAYGDADGVTERFVRNVFTVVNRDLGAQFEQDRFAFEPYWDPGEEWMDIGFRSLAEQSIPIPGLDIRLELAAEERLRIEISAKFRLEGITRELAAANLAVRRTWTDAKQQFALLLAQPGS